MDSTDSPISNSVAGWISNLRSSTVARDGLYVLTAQGLATAIALVADSLLFRELSLLERGTLTTALAIQAVLLIIADLGLSLTTVRIGSEYHAKGLYDEAHAVFRSALFIRLSLALLLTILSFFLAPTLTHFPLAAVGRTHLVWAPAMAVVGTTLVAWGVDVAQSRRKFGIYFALQVTAALLRTVAIAAVIYVASKQLSDHRVEQPSSEIVLWAICGASLLAGLISVLLQKSVLIPSLNSLPSNSSALNQQLRRFSRYAAASVLLNGIGGYVEVFMIQGFFDSSQTAVFEGGRRLAMILPLLTTAITTVLLPRAAALNSTAACAEYLKKAIKISLPLALLSAIGLAAMASILVPLLWGNKYEASVPVLHWLCLAHAFAIALNPLTLVLYPLRREGTIILLNALSFVLSIVLGLWLIPRYGPMGAAWSLCGLKGIMTVLFGAVLVLSIRKGRTS